MQSRRTMGPKFAAPLLGADEEALRIPGQNAQRPSSFYKNEDARAITSSFTPTHQSRPSLKKAYNHINNLFLDDGVVFPGATASNYERNYETSDSAGLPAKKRQRSSNKRGLLS